MFIEKAIKDARKTITIQEDIIGILDNMNSLDWPKVDIFSGSNFIGIIMPYNLDTPYRLVRKNLLAMDYHLAREEFHRSESGTEQRTFERENCPHIIVFLKAYLPGSTCRVVEREETKIVQDIVCN